MAEFECEVQVVGLKYICDNCNNGEMYFNGVMLHIDPPLFEHQCDTCGNVQNLKTKYPTFEVRRI